MYELYKDILKAMEKIGSVVKSNFNETPGAWESVAFISAKLEDGTVVEVNCRIEKPEQGEEDDS